MDIMPDTRESLVRKGKGPFNRNLVMPNELENRDNANVSTGTVEMVWVDSPMEPEPYNPWVTKMMAREMCTLKLFKRLIVTDLNF